MFSSSYVLRLISGLLFIAAGATFLFIGREVINFVLAGLFIFAGVVNIALIFVFKKIFENFDEKR
ncbi:MAG: hypothetical protein QMC81_07630 [Thermoanaerobacterales bacterium]|nr:hypothetical protein [Bacillota bacterium]MDI6907339.1 hypothetical protein [Thermoanaerobacterales bacterium]